MPSTEVKTQRLYVFSDASVKAIAAVAYLKTVDNKGQCHTGFVMGKVKLAPLLEHTIPRLELCAAVLAVELAELITSEINLAIQDTEFYTDSKVVLGYIYNQTRRFYVYVNNRVLRIRRSTSPKQWHFVPTDHNPADLATRSVAASHLKDTVWFTGPAFLYNPGDPILLTPASLLTQKTGTVNAPSGEFGTKDLYKRQWRQVQVLANTFWDRWKKQYLPTLQTRTKWHTVKPNLKPDDIVLVKDS